VTRTPTEHAADWLTAQFRGNNAESDAKVQHIVCGLMEEALGLERGPRRLRDRIDRICAHSDSMNELGRAVIVGIFALRNVVDEEEAADLIRQTRNDPPSTIDILEEMIQGYAVQYAATRPRAPDWWTP
jgi:hypothetical protein